MISMKFEGGAELAAEFAKLSTRLSKSIIRGALVEAAEPIRKGAAAHAARGQKGPHIADHIVISNARSEVDPVAVATGPAKGFAYGLPLEIGTIDTAAQPFMRPGFDAHLEDSLKIAGEAMWRELAGKGISRPTTFAPDVPEAPGGGDLL